MAASIDRPAAGMRVALVCLSNVNRSMEAHHLFARHHYAPRSFGTGAWNGWNGLQLLLLGGAALDLARAEDLCVACKCCIENRILNLLIAFSILRRQGQTAR